MWIFSGFLSLLVKWKLLTFFNLIFLTVSKCDKLYPKCSKVHKNIIIPYLTLFNADFYSEIYSELILLKHAYILIGNKEKNFKSLSDLSCIKYLKWLFADACKIKPNQSCFCPIYSADVYRTNLLESSRVSLNKEILRHPVVKHW